MAGLSRIIAKELGSMLGITDNPKFNPKLTYCKAFKNAVKSLFLVSFCTFIEGYVRASHALTPFCSVRKI